MKFRKCKIAIIIFFVFISVMAKPLYQSHAQISSSTTVNATVKINVCGDNAIEGSEDCEGSNLNGKSCTSLGYSGGNLTCDIACDFDEFACIAATPTPTPTLTSTITPTPTSSVGVTASSPTPILTASITSTPIPVGITQSSLPPALKAFDLNGIGKILASDLQDVVKLWVDEWKQAVTEELNGSGDKNNRKCDINQDQTCNTKDFSVLMFYVAN